MGVFGGLSTTVKENTTDVFCANNWSLEITRQKKVPGVTKVRVVLVDIENAPLVARVKKLELVLSIWIL